MATILPFRRAAPSPLAAFVLEVTLADVRPAIWRRLRVAQSLTLRELHHVLQIAFGWNDSHLHEFRAGERRFGIVDPEDNYAERPLDEREAALGAIASAQGRLEYAYDFGDDWVLEIAVKASPPLEPNAPKAECLEGARAGPPDDCGGPGGYERLVEVLADKTHEDYKDLRRWAGARFHPEKLALASINREIRRAGTRAFRTSRERGYDGL